MPRVLPMLLALLLGVGCAYERTPSPEAVAGVLDLRDHEALLAERVTLDGQWEAWWGQLLTPEELEGRPPSGMLDVPGGWEGALITPGGAPSRGHATMRLRVLLPPEHGPLVLRWDDLWVASEVWVDGALEQRHGQVGESMAEEVPEVGSQLRVVADEAEGEAGELEIVLMVSNYHHRVGGVRHSVALGSPEEMLRLERSLVTGDVVAVVTMLVSGLYFMVVYRMRPSNPATIFFALFCLNYGVRTIFAGGAQLYRGLPVELSWLSALRLDYITTYAALGFGMEMMARMFPDHASWRVVRVGRVMSVMLLGLALLAPSLVYTECLPVFHLGVLLGLTVVILDVRRAVLQAHPLAKITAAGLGLFFIGAVHDILFHLHLLPTSSEIAPLAFFLFLFSQAWAHAREFSRSYDTIEELSEDLRATNQDLVLTNEAVQRFVPYAFLDLLNKNSIKDVERGDHAGLEMGILFCDLRGFTTLVEGLSPARAFEFINRYLRVMEPAIHRHGGFINQYLGDCIMALFPGGLDEAAVGAVEMLAALRAWNEERAAEGLPPVRVGVGLSAGPLMLGTIGGMDRLDNGVIGDAVNRSARLEGLTKQYGTLMIADSPFVERLSRPEALRMRPLDLVVPKGKTEAVRLYEVLDGLPDDLAQRRLDSLEHFTAGLEAWEDGDFQRAAQCFGRCLEADPDDGPAAALLARCEALLEEPPEGPWAGVTYLARK